MPHALAAVLALAVVVRWCLQTAHRMYMLCQLTEVVLLEVYAATLVVLWTLRALRLFASDSTARPPLPAAYLVAAAAA